MMISSGTNLALRFRNWLNGGLQHVHRRLLLPCPPESIPAAGPEYGDPGGGLQRRLDHPKTSLLADAVWNEQYVFRIDRGVLGLALQHLAHVDGDFRAGRAARL